MSVLVPLLTGTCELNTLGDVWVLTVKYVPMGIRVDLVESGWVNGSTSPRGREKSGTDKTSTG